MKLNKKFLIIIIYVFISFISQINYGICSDNVYIPPPTPPNAPTAQTQPQAPVPVVQQQPQQAAPVPPNLQTGGATNVNQGFIPVFINMIKSLFSVIILIIAGAGIIIFYKRIKSKGSSAAKSKKQKVHESESNEPGNVSEAVSSFVRHKIKRIT